MSGFTKRIIIYVTNDGYINSDTLSTIMSTLNYHDTEINNLNLAADGYVVFDGNSNPNSMVIYNNGKMQGTNIDITASGDLIGADFVKTRSGNISRDSQGISQISLIGGRTLTITRANGFVYSITDGTRTWTISRDVNNNISGWIVSQ